MEPDNSVQPFRQWKPVQFQRSSLPHFHSVLTPQVFPHVLPASPIHHRLPWSADPKLRPSIFPVQQQHRLHLFAVLFQAYSLSLRQSIPVRCLHQLDAADEMCLQILAANQASLPEAQLWLLLKPPCMYRPDQTQNLLPAHNRWWHKHLGNAGSPNP